MDQSCLVIPDIHLAHLRAHAIIDRYQDVNRIILLGDMFDNFGDSPEKNQATAVWLRSLMEDPRVTVLMGNHDAPYLAPPSIAEFRTCPGYHPAKDRAIRSVITPEIAKRIQLAEEHNGWLLSHAGIHSYYSWTPKWVDLEATICVAEACLWNGEYHPLFHDGYRINGHTVPPGGILWQDWDHEFKPMDRIPQIVGHTPASMPRLKRSPNGTPSVCLDTGLKHYGIIETDGSLLIHSDRGKLIHTVSLPPS